MRDTQMTDYYFAYGMLTHPDLMPGGEFLGSATLDGFRPEMLAYANIVADRSASFRGVLWGVNRQIIRELDQVEGYPDFYARIRVDVRDEKARPVTAWVYTMTPDSRLIMMGRKPAPNYLRSVRMGYHHAGIPYPFES